MDITITIPDAQLPRVTAYVRSRFDLQADPVTGEVPPEPTNAELLAEFKRIITRYIKAEVQQYELLEQHKAVFDAYAPIDPT